MLGILYVTFTSVTRAGAVGTSEMITVRTAAVPDVTCSTKGAQNHALHADQHNHVLLHSQRHPNAFTMSSRIQRSTRREKAERKSWQVCSNPQVSVIENYIESKVTCTSTYTGMYFLSNRKSIFSLFELV